MANDPFSLKQPSSNVINFEVSDEVNQPGQTWAFSMKAKRAIGVHLQESMAEVLKKRYITGSPQDRMEAIAFPQVGGEDIEISDSLFETASQIWSLQVGATAIPAIDDIGATVPGGMSAEQIIALAAVAPNAWVDLLKKCREVTSKEGKGLDP